MTTTQYVTVDEPTSRDLDDAFHVQRDGPGWRVWIAIAAPALQVPIGSTADRAARAAAATVYGGTRVIAPMLAAEISEQTATLTEGVPRPAMQLEIHLDSQVTPRLAKVSLETITVFRRLTYEDVPRLAKEGKSALNAHLASAADLGNALLQARRSAGSLAFFDAAHFVYLDEEGSVRQASSYGDMVGHVVVQELMILANRLLAAWAIEQDVPFLYRNHQARLAAPPPAELSQQLTTAAADPKFVAAALQERMTLLMGTAQYGPSASGHYALALSHYAHCTSPLRRYADLVNQRQVLAKIAGEQHAHSQKELVAIADDINTTLAEAKTARSEHMKAAVQKRAARALDAGQLARMGSPEFVQAIKLCARSGEFDQGLESLLVDRMAAGTLDDKVLDALVEASTFPGARYPERLLQAWACHMASRPESAKHFLMFALQTDLARDYSATDRPAAGGFEVVVRLTCAKDARFIETTARAPRKKDADNLASARAMCAFLDAPDQVQDLKQAAVAPASAPTAASPPADGVNWKGRLLETCQKRKWPAPTFSVDQSGPSNAPTFTCRAALKVAGTTHAAEVTVGGTKKAAEAAAACELWQRVERL